MRRFGFIASGLGLWVIGGYMFYKNAIQIDYMDSINIWWSAIIPIGLLFVGAIPFIYGVTSDNIYRIKTGRVIAHDFTPRHYVQGTTTYSSVPTANGGTIMVPIMIPGHWEEDDWALQIEDESGHTGWLHFSAEVFSEYPTGTHYPRS